MDKMKRKSWGEKTVKELILKDNKLLQLTTGVEGPPGYENITYNDKQRVLFDRYLHGEIDVNILTKGLETLESKINQKDNQHLGYA